MDLKCLIIIDFFLQLSSSWKINSYFSIFPTDRQQICDRSAVTAKLEASIKCRMRDWIFGR